MSGVGFGAERGAEDGAGRLMGPVQKARDAAGNRFAVLLFRAAELVGGDREGGLSGIGLAAWWRRNPAKAEQLKPE